MFSFPISHFGGEAVGGGTSLFWPGYSALSVSEDAINSTAVGTVTANGGVAPISYSIISGNGDGVFAINSSTGQITVTNNSNLDYESTTSYALSIRATDSDSPSDTADTTITITVTNVIELPVNTAVPVISGTPTVGQSLSVTNGSWASDSALSYAHQWKRSGTPISGATSSSYTLTSADYNTTITCTVTATNSDGSADATSAATASVAEGAPVNTALPVISGTTTVGQSLSVTVGTWDSVSSPSYAYQWQRSGADISGATSSSYTLVSADYNTTITCEVTATNTAGSTMAESAATTSVAETVPGNTALPVISGTAEVGQTLTVTTGSWNSISTPGYSYQWQGDGSNISGATSSSYVLTSNEIGEVITCEVTATNTAGSTMAESAATDAVMDNTSSAPTHSLVFNGSTDYLSMADTDWGSYNRSTFAFACSVKPEAFGSNDYIACKRTSQREFMIRMTSGGADLKLMVEGRDAVGNNYSWLTQNDAIVEDEWNAILVHFDFTNATNNDKVKIWVNNSAHSCTITSTSQTSVYTSTAPVGIGARGNNGNNKMTGKIYQPTFFSGALPATTDVFDGSAGKIKDLSALTGVHSLLDISGGSVTNDAVLSASWTNHGSVGSSTDIP